MIRITVTPPGKESFSKTFGTATEAQEFLQIIRQGGYEAAQQSVQRTATAEHVFPCLNPECEICETLRQA